MILSALLLLIYPLVIQYKRGGLWRVLVPFTAVALLLDVLSNYTEWAFVWGKPPAGCYTISKRIKWEMDNGSDSRQEIAHLIQIYLDAFEPDGSH